MTAPSLLLRKMFFPFLVFLLSACAHGATLGVIKSDKSELPKQCRKQQLHKFLTAHGWSVQRQTRSAGSHVMVHNKELNRSFPVALHGGRVRVDIARAIRKHVFAIARGDDRCQNYFGKRNAGVDPGPPAQQVAGSAAPRPARRSGGFPSSAGACSAVDVQAAAQARAQALLVSEINAVQKRKNEEAKAYEKRVTGFLESQIYNVTALLINGRPELALAVLENLEIRLNEKADLEVAKTVRHFVRPQRLLLELKFAKLQSLRMAVGGGDAILAAAGGEGSSVAERLVQAERLLREQEASSDSLLALEVGQAEGPLRGEDADGNSPSSSCESSSEDLQDSDGELLLEESSDSSGAEVLGDTSAEQSSTARTGPSSDVAAPSSEHGGETQKTNEELFAWVVGLEDFGGVTRLVSSASEPKSSEFRYLDSAALSSAAERSVSPPFSAAEDSLSSAAENGGDTPIHPNDQSNDHPNDGKPLSLSDMREVLDRGFVRVPRLREVVLKKMVRTLLEWDAQLRNMERKGDKREDAVALAAFRQELQR